VSACGLHFPHWQWRNTSVTRDETCCFLLIISSGLPCLARKCLHCWGACLLQWVTSQLSPQKWASCRSGLPRPSTGPSRPCRLFMYRQMIIPTRRQWRLSPTWMRPLHLSVPLQKKQFIRRWIRWLPHPEFLIPGLLVRSIIPRLVKSSGFYSAIRICRISLPFWELMN